LEVWSWRLEVRLMLTFTALASNRSFIKDFQSELQPPTSNL